MALRTGTPAREEPISTAAASWEAPIHTKRAMKRRRGLAINPTKPKRSAIPWPAVAAMRVART